jgi:PAS domain S-box-containing protein
LNPAVERYLGWAEGELIGRHILEMHPPEKREEADRILKRMFSGEIDEYPLELATKDGRSIPVSTKVWSGRWDGKECIFGISKNLRKEQEALLRFTKLFENNPMPMVISSAQDGKFIEVNRAFLEKLGYAREEVIGHTAVELQLFVNPILRQLVGGEISRKGAIKNVEMEYRCKDGTVLTGLFSGEQLDVQGVRCFLTVTVDITEKVRMRRDLAAQRQRLKNIIDGTRLATWEWNVQTGETIFNERWAEMLGYTLAELQPTSIETWEKLAHPDDLAESDRLLQKHFAGESDFYSFESRMRHKDGHWIWVWDGARWWSGTREACRSGCSAPTWTSPRSKRWKKPSGRRPNRMS